MKLKVFKSATETATALIEYIQELMSQDETKGFHIAFSGGSTPALMFDLWANDYAESTDWKRLFIYFVDERCVPPEDSDSNYGLMKKLMLDHVSLNENQVFRIHGENDPNQEAVAYSKLCLSKMPNVNGFPEFDLVLLGAGDDGHTSSIFPGQEEHLTSSEPFVAAYNPYSGQKRIAMTGNTIINAKQIVFLITGKNKGEVVSDIYSSGDTGPAAYVAHHSTHVDLFLDEAASLKIN